jgi:arylsulfatase
VSFNGGRAIAHREEHMIWPKLRTPAVALAAAGGILLAAGIARRRADAFHPLIYREILAAAHRLGSRPSPGGQPSFLLITVDTLRADHMGSYGYPRPTTPCIDAWFRGAQVFESAYSTEANTTPSVMSILTGMLPQQHRIRLFFQRVSPDILTVADLLRPAGYETAAVVSNMVLTAEAVGLDRRFDHYDDFVDEREPYRRSTYDRRASRTTDAALAWLRGRRDQGRPFLLWVHYIDPHGPYLPPEDAPTRFSHPVPRPVDASRIPDYQRHPGLSDGLAYVDLYDAEIAYADREIGRLLGAFGGLALRDYLAIFTADHGESMMEHEQWFSHGYQVHEEIIHVPLLVRSARGRSGRVTNPVSLADIAPTLLEYAGIPPPPGAYAVSLSRVRAERPVFSEATDRAHQWRSAVLGSRKWVVELRPPAGNLFTELTSRFGWRGILRPTLVTRGSYDLGADPKELAMQEWPPGEAGRELLRLIEEDPDAAGTASPAWDRAAGGHGPEAPKVARAVDRKTLEGLRSLGYVR